MKHYLVDTNVVIDMLLDREDADAACAVFDGAERGEYVLHICALSFTTIYYSLRKFLTREQRIDALTQSSDALEVAHVDDDVINMALKSGWKDFEDAVQYTVAESNGVNCIITRNKGDFEENVIPCYSPQEFLEKYRKGI